MKILVTGSAGFIGSSLSESLVRSGHQVTGVDCFLPNYSELMKRKNLENLLGDERFTLIESDVGSIAQIEFLGQFEAVCHLAGLPGVRDSWGDDNFFRYENANVSSTLRLLEGARKAGVRRFVYASSSSVYGGSLGGQLLSETQVPHPTSPYAVTKLSGEHLCSLYGGELGLSTISLRFFTVFGPRQRPDMAIRRIISAALMKRPFVVFGDGLQSRDFTFVGDVVEAIMFAISTDTKPGSVVNIGSGHPIALLDVVHEVEDLLQLPVDIRFERMSPGDPMSTRADVSLAGDLLGWRPKTPLRDGLEQQVAWQITG